MILASTQNSTQENDRFFWIDNLRALGIFFVILGHNNIDHNIKQYIFSFHVPLFFFISGYLFTETKYAKFKIFCKRKIKSLLIPYFIFASTSYLFWLLIVRNLSIKGESLSMNPWKSLIGIFYSVGIGDWWIPLNIALWFVTCLFIVEVLFWFFTKYANGNRTLLLAIITIVGALGYLSSLFLSLKLPCSADTAMTALVFYGVGYFFKINNISASTQLKINIKNILFLFILFSLNIILCFLNEPVDMNYNRYGNVLLFYISAFSGIFFYMSLSKMIKKNFFISYIGGNTIIILGLSGIIMFIFNGVIFLITGSKISHLHSPLIVSIFFSILQILGMIPVIYFINRYLPFLLGREKLLRTL